MKYRMPDKPLLLLFVGPTAVGKTRMAIDVAKIMGQVEIISGDSRLFYRGMDIGTAKPTVVEIQGVPHHLIDIADPDEIISLGVFQKMALTEIDEILRRKHIPMIVGGTGQYIRSVIQGWSVPAVVPDARLREALEKVTPDAHLAEWSRWLQKLDPAAYQQVDLRNPRRVIRALEIILTSGKTYSSQRTATESPFRLIQIGLTMPRKMLFERIDARVDDMLRSGLEQEVRKLLEKGYSPDLPSMSAIGYQEMAAYIAGKTNLEEAEILIKRRTHSFVRRQANWFKESDPDIKWFLMPKTRPDEIVDYLENQISHCGQDNER
jgi:tRNA dimethylallyltransferase